MLDNSGFGHGADTAAGIDSGSRQREGDQHVVGGTSQPQAVHDSCDAALAVGVLVVPSAETTATTPVIYPWWPVGDGRGCGRSETAHAIFEYRASHFGIAARRVLSTVPASLGLKQHRRQARRRFDRQYPYHDYTSPALRLRRWFDVLTLRDQVASISPPHPPQLLDEVSAFPTSSKNAWDAGAYAVIISNNTSGSWQADMGYLTFRPGITIFSGGRRGSGRTMAPRSPSP